MRIWSFRGSLTPLLKKGVTIQRSHLEQLNAAAQEQLSEIDAQVEEERTLLRNSLAVKRDHERHVAEQELLGVHEQRETQADACGCRWRMTFRS